MCHHAIEKVLQLALGTFAKTDNFAHKLEKLVTQTSLLTGKDVGLEKCRRLAEDQGRRQHRYHSHPQQGAHLDQQQQQFSQVSRAPVTYIKVSENPLVSIGIFIVREGECIPLHDHPNMHGIIKCLQGRLRISSFTRKEMKADDIPERFASGELRRRVECGHLFIAEAHQPVILGPDSPSCCLSPLHGNIHQVESLDGPAAFLDILSPPYNIDPPPDKEDQEVRDCNYYKPVREEVDRSSNLVWLHLTPPPTSFFCDTEPYRGPALNGSEDC